MQFLNDKNVCLVEIHWQIVEAYGEGAMNNGNVRRWCGFKEGRITVWNEVGAHIWSRVI
jgi:hypothetical protein